MFTGIVTARGRVVATEREGDRLRLTIEAPYQDLVPGESIAVSGACLTVVRAAAGRFSVEVVVTTRNRTRLAELEPGDEVNLERALALGERLGGHLVQGHVDGLATVTAVRPAEDAVLVDLELPEDVAWVTVPRGSITVDGVSLTVSAVPRFGQAQVALIPFTREQTTLGRLKPGDQVHVEGDLIGKYLRHLLAARGEPGG